ncbi:uncharacterized protein LOC126978792 [Leptidea sinapis]|uniref:uncharacterized protein LOC126978792 n=1 Tax=Leptidea sinapis TaxID=189913 RepID=UPI00213A6A67|nr:uncharacterized protein LOC126978792 [Leptidea sinapis]
MLEEASVNEAFVKSFHSDAELENLIRLIKYEPADMAGTPRLEGFPSNETDYLSSENNAISKKFIEKIMSEISTPEGTMSICTYIPESMKFRARLYVEAPKSNIKSSLEKNEEASQLLQTLQEDKKKIVTTLQPKTSHDNVGNKGDDKETREKNIKQPEWSYKKTEEIDASSVKNTKSGKSKNNVKRKEYNLAIPNSMSIQKSHHIQSQIELWKKMNKKTSHHKETKSLYKSELPRCYSFPVLSRRTTEISQEEKSSDTVLECLPRRSSARRLIFGCKILKKARLKSQSVGSFTPLLFKCQYNFLSNETLSQKVSKTGSKELHAMANAEILQQDTPRGITQYMLSNRKFIENGVTILPTSKIMRKMYVFKMEPVDPKLNWFYVYRNEVLKYYDTGELLAKIYSSERGILFYKNGLKALDFRPSAELDVGQIYLIFGCNDNTNLHEKKPFSIVACFDQMGNGIVYDHCGKVRLKYNQTEGIVLDKKIGPHTRWQWHCLNDPPDLVHVHLEKYESKLQNNYDRKAATKTFHADMVAIELENIARQKASKMATKFRPYQIRMKVVKLNDYISLRILNQSNIYILFRNGKTRLKLNVGMKLKVDEIIDMQTSDVSEVFTPYDKGIPILHESSQDIQDFIKEAELFQKSSRLSYN